MSNQSKHQQARDLLVHWLLEFRFSTRRILGEVLGMRAGSVGQFFLLLEKKGVVNKVKVPFIHEYVYFLGKSGRDIGLELSDKGENYSTTKSSVLSAYVVHHLGVQIAVLHRTSVSVPFSFASEWHIDMHVSSRPDALLMDMSGISTALEVELTQKTAPRIYVSFLMHLEQIRQGLYHKVEYTFSSQGLLALYRKKFDAVEWPLYTRNKKGHVIRSLNEDGKPLSANADDPKIRERFTFTHEELYQ